MMIKNLCALVPSYNEARTIGYIVKNLVSRRIITYAIDDGSTDNSAEIAKSEGAVVLRHKANKGKGAALREGFSHILKKDFDAVLVMDGDNQHEVDDIDAFLKKIEETGADIVIGNRMLDTKL